MPLKIWENLAIVFAMCYLNLSYTCIGDMGAYNDAMDNFILADRYNSNHDKAYHNLRVLYYRKGMDVLGDNLFPNVGIN